MGWESVGCCNVCLNMFPAAHGRDKCWRHRKPYDPEDDEVTDPGILPALPIYQLDGEYLKTLKGL